MESEAPFVSSAIARKKKSLLLTKSWRFHNDVYVFRSKGFREDFGQSVCRQQRRCVVQIDLELVEIRGDSLVGGNGNLPKIEGVCGDVLECGLLFNLDGFLEAPDGFCRRNFDRKDAVARFAEHQTVESNDLTRVGIQASVRVY